MKLSNRCVEVEDKDYLECPPYLLSPHYDVEVGVGRGGVIEEVLERALPEGDVAEVDVVAGTLLLLVLILLKAFAATAAERAEFNARERLADIAISGMW